MVSQKSFQISYDLEIVILEFKDRDLGLKMKVRIGNRKDCIWTVSDLKCMGFIFIPEENKMSFKKRFVENYYN